MSELKYQHSIKEKEEMRRKEFEIYSNPTLSELIDFEKRSWPEEEQASAETLRKRLANFSKGFSVAKNEEGTIIGQTFWKPVTMPNEIESFDEMSEAPVDLNGKTLWGVNMAVDPEFTGKGIASELAISAIRLAKKLGVNNMQAGLRVEKMKEMMLTGKIDSPEEYPVGTDVLARAFVRAANEEGVVISFSKPQKYWEIDEESMGYATIVKIEIEDKEKKMSNTLDRCVAETVAFGEERIEYFVIGPHRGCPLGCKFCGVKAAKTCESNLGKLGYLDEKSGLMTKKYGEVIFDEFRNLADDNATDVLLLNGGNILREEEMFPSAIIEWIPKFIAESKSFESLAIEVRADDVISKIILLCEIQKNLGSKQLVVRLPIEYADETLLANSGKGISLEIIGNAIELLNEKGITWDAYAMLGGFNLEKESAIDVAEKTVRLAFEKGARNVILNSQFITADMESIAGNILVPSLGDNIELLRRLRDVHGKIKVGFDGDELLNPITVPEGTDEERILLKKFNEYQEI